MNHARRLGTFLFLLTALPSPARAALTLQDVHTASSTTVVVFFKGSSAVVDEVDTTDPARWTVNGQPAAAIHKYVMQADSADHRVYLTVPPLVSGTTYAITTPHGSATLAFDDHLTFCEAIKTNQAAYSPLARNNRALFAIWLGDGGAQPLAGALPTYEVFAPLTGTVVATGTLTPGTEDATSGDIVYGIDLSTVPEGGPYQISVAGHGVSYPFGVGAGFSRRLAHILFRGQFYQRCGCPSFPPHTLDIRKQACHTTIAKVDGPIGEANLTVTGTEPTFTMYGGYHDAGDADRRAYHLANPIVNLMVYEAFPTLFTDGQYDLPDRFDAAYNVLGQGNGIPDILDEAAWGTLAWEYLQNDDGSIQFGTETRGYADPFVSPLDLDTKKYGTVKIDDRAAAVGAGLFLQLARHLRPYDPTHAAVLAQRGQQAFAYVGARMAAPEKLYYAIQRYLWDGDEAAHADVKALKSAVDSYKQNVFLTQGYSLNDAKFDNPAYFLSYLVETERPTDPEVVAYFKAALKDAADANVAEWKKHAYPVGNNPTGSAWGHNVRQPSYATAPLLHYRFSQDQTYLDAAADLMSYTLGLNPLGISYVTGVGFHQVHNPHDRESAYTKAMGVGPKPGITVFGPGIPGNTAVVIFPAMGTLPKERQFADNQNAISMTEFTIFETMAHNALYTVLAGGGTFTPGTDPFQGVGAPAGPVPSSDPPAAGDADAGPAPTVPRGANWGGCGCATGRPTGTSLALPALTVLGLVAWGRRRRRPPR